MWWRKKHKVKISRILVQLALEDAAQEVMRREIIKQASDQLPKEGGPLHVTGVNVNVTFTTFDIASDTIDFEWVD